MSLAAWLKANLKEGAAAQAALDHAAATGKSATTVAIQARRLGYKAVAGVWQHVGTPPPAQPRAAKAVAISSHTLAPAELQDERARWASEYVERTPGTAFNAEFMALAKKGDALRRPA